MSEIRSGATLQSFKSSLNVTPFKKEDRKQLEDPLALPDENPPKSPAETALDDIAISVSQAMADGDPPGKLPFGGSIKALEVVVILASAAESAKTKGAPEKTGNSGQAVTSSTTKNPKENALQDGNNARITHSEIILNPTQDISDSYAEAITNNTVSLPKLTTAFQSAVEQLEVSLQMKKKTDNIPVSTIPRPVKLPLIEKALAVTERANKAGTIASDSASSASDAAASVSMQLYISPKISTLALLVARETAAGAVAENYEAGKVALTASQAAFNAVKKIKVAVKSLEENPENEALKTNVEKAIIETREAAERAENAAGDARKSEVNTLAKGQELVETAAMAENTLEDFAQIEKRPLNEQLFAIDKLITEYTPANIKRYVVAQKEALIKKHLPFDIPMSTKNGEMRAFIDSFKKVTQDTHGFTFNSRVSTIVGELENYNDIITRYPDDAGPQLKILDKVLKEVKNFLTNAGDSTRVGWVRALEKKLESAKIILTGKFKNDSSI